MEGVERFREFHAEATEWRRHLHRNPELGFRVEKTALFVAEKLASFGINHIETGIAETGIVAVIQGEGGEGPTIGLRADMDALPILEASGKDWSSETPGRMHGCGHDGHSAMLLGAAKHLAQTRNFRGSVALIFQPAEEILPSGAQKMVQEGFLDRFSISQVFGLHNTPGVAVGKFATCHGPVLSSLDDFDLVIKGKSGHAARPHEGVDPIVIAAQVILGLQTLVSRLTNPLEALVISVTKINSGIAYNVIPEQVNLAGTVRTFSPALSAFAEGKMRESAKSIARVFGGDAELDYRRDTPVTVNHAAETDLAIKAAQNLVGTASVNAKMSPRSSSEDFAFMLEARPGAIMYLGNGPTAALHNPAYDFDDEVLPYGIGYWVTLVETVLAPQS
ncbi:M20 aminoacylase family protein [Mesorhizobium sp.]|uniref:M20 aminoacylase family protein n=1 Tax=Mesorhizobium sp. TaxID=1871066 RepID=UPI001206BFBA|nr:M20 aminoacylase family protein [Mesorhizobium sp.]TIL34616.1 MAG: amidohydrolase [Mesorhizobium sp.]TIM48615.1 MAG: amidohydrolase [Mesorhizobium sp.]